MERRFSEKILKSKIKVFLSGLKGKRDLNVFLIFM